MKVFLYIIGWTSVALLLIQFVKVEVPEAPKASASDEIITPEEITTLLKRSCYDCHSNTTNWPWYANIAPISFEVRGHVRDGRRWLNFQIWNRYDTKKQQERLKGIVKTINIKMPPPVYLMAHPEAKLNRNERESIKKWAQSKIQD